MSESTTLSPEMRGRGTPDEPPNRFEKLHVSSDEAFFEGTEERPERPAVATEFFSDDTQSIISKNSSPDISFTHSLNPYRGCEHGCAYCYARPYHEFLGFNAGLDFETRIMVKSRAAELLEAELGAPSWGAPVLACSGVTDPYQPIEKKLEITRSCLEVLAECRNPVGMITKNHLITRDLDYLSELAAHQATAVHISITSLDADLARKLEPRASSPRARLKAVRALREAGVPVGVSVAPIIPGLNDHEIPAILEAASDHGAMGAFYTAVRLPYGVGPLFEAWLERHFPDQKEKIMGRIREMRGGKTNDSRFGHRMRGEGPIAEQIKTLFRVSARRFGLDKMRPRYSNEAFRRPPKGQLMLF